MDEIRGNVPEEIQQLHDQALISNDIISKHDGTDHPIEYAKDAVEFREIYKQLPAIAGEMAISYKEILSRHGKEPGRVSIHMVGGRAKGAPLKEESDIDLIVVCEDIKQSMERIALNNDDAWIRTSEIKEFAERSHRLFQEAGLRDDLIHIISFGAPEPPEGGQLLYSE